MELNINNTNNTSKNNNTRCFNNFKGLTDIQSISNLIKKER